MDALGFLAETRAKRLRWAMAINFTQPRPNNRKYLKQVTSWVEDALPDSMDDVTVMVNEMQCFEPVRGTALTLAASAQCPTEHL